MRGEETHQPAFAELTRAVHGGELAGPAEPRRRRLLPSVEAGGSAPDPTDAFIYAAATAFGERLAEYLTRLEAAGLDPYKVLGTPEEFAERAVRKAFSPS